MAWVPIVVPNRRNRGYRNRAGGGIFAAVILLMIFGFLAFFFFNSSDGFVTPIWFIISGFGVFLIIIVIIAAIASSMSQVNKKPNETNIKFNQFQAQRPVSQQNPYIVRNSFQKQEEPLISREIKREIPITNDINYCRFCGSKIDRDAVFCHMCGTKL
ncbi:MAG: zinc-ribbon domain-containing protein [Candidatus Hermodarchaeota archaeon]